MPEVMYFMIIPWHTRSIIRKYLSMQLHLYVLSSIIFSKRQQRALENLENSVTFLFFSGLQERIYNHLLMQSTNSKIFIGPVVLSTSGSNRLRFFLFPEKLSQFYFESHLLADSFQHVTSIFFLSSHFILFSFAYSKHLFYLVKSF